MRHPSESLRRREVLYLAKWTAITAFASQFLGCGPEMPLSTDRPNLGLTPFSLQFLPRSDEKDKLELRIPGYNPNPSTVALFEQAAVATFSPEDIDRLPIGTVIRFALNHDGTGAAACANRNAIKTQPLVHRVKLGRDSLTFLSQGLYPKNEPEGEDGKCADVPNNAGLFTLKVPKIYILESLELFVSNHLMPNEESFTNISAFLQFLVNSARLKSTEDQWMLIVPESVRAAFTSNLLISANGSKIGAGHIIQTINRLRGIDAENEKGFTQQQLEENIPRCTIYQAKNGVNIDLANPGPPIQAPIGLRGIILAAEWSQKHGGFVMIDTRGRDTPSDDRYSITEWNNLIDPGIYWVPAEHGFVDRSYYNWNSPSFDNKRHLHLLY